MNQAMFRDIKTVKDAEDFERRLRMVLESVHDTQESVEATMRRVLSETEMAVLGPSPSYESIEKCIQGLQALPLVEIELAFVPSAAFMEKLAGKVKEKAGDEAVLQIMYAEDIIGGATVSFGGRRGDYSVKKKLAGMQF